MTILDDLKGFCPTSDELFSYGDGFNVYSNGRLFKINECIDERARFKELV